MHDEDRVAAPGTNFAGADAVAADAAAADTDIAVIGLAGRFPGAGDVERFWSNIAQSVESLTVLSDKELLASGATPDLLRNPQFVRVGAVLDGVELFDADFFGVTPGEAAATDPQHRVFLECAWEALENAGYEPTDCRGPVGVFAGAGMNTYVFNLVSQYGVTESVSGFQAMLGNDKDYLSTRVSYKLGLEGPSVSVQTACSTSLVAVHLAGQSLLAGECDTALAGGVSIRVPQKAGYLFQEGWILSPDGHCRAFDARARGTVRGSGVGIVVLKRLVDALADRDYIRAVIKGSAINNDGALKVGYTAPRADGQANVIVAAHSVAGVSADTLQYVEAHGTGTELGDPIEIAALTTAFRESTARNGFCALGSVKTNIGHLDAAAGIAGLLKVVLALEHRELPASLHFESPNPKIDFASSPFYVNTRPRPWPRDGDRPRRAGVSSFGIGGTNAHAVVEEAPARTRVTGARVWQLVPLSARTPQALEQATSNLADHLVRHPELEPGDVAFTLGVGRRAFDQRRAVVGRDPAELTAAMRAGDGPRAVSGTVQAGARGVVFMFPGQGSQHLSMGSGLYETQPVYRDAVDRCARLLQPMLDLDVRDLICHADVQNEALRAELDRTSRTQPALFTVEYAAAMLCLSWGIRPRAMLGHSLGEYVAACLAEVLTLEEALGLVAERGRLVEALAGGAMLAVMLPERELVGQLPDEVSLAASNAPAVCVVSGPVAAIDALRGSLSSRGVATRPLHTSHAFHSAMMDPALAELTALARTLHARPPIIPYLSNVTGTWMTAAEAGDPGYWAAHLRRPVRFAEALEVIAADRPLALLEVGPGATLAALARRHPAAPRTVVSILPQPRAGRDDAAHALTAVAQLWVVGAPVDWRSLHDGRPHGRVPLPTYPFQRQAFWVDRRPDPVSPASSAGLDGGVAQDAAGFAPADTGQTGDRREPAWLGIDRYLFVPTWRESPLATAPQPDPDHDGPRTWLVFGEPDVGARVAQGLSLTGGTVVTVSRARALEPTGECSYQLDPANPQHYRDLLRLLRERQALPDSIVHLWSIGPGADDLDRATEQEGRSFYSLLYLGQALGWEMPGAPVRIAVVTSRMQRVPGDREVAPHQALVLGPCRVIPLEYPTVSCRVIDVDAVDPAAVDGVADALVSELLAGGEDPVVALREARRWLQLLGPANLDAGRAYPPGLGSVRDGAYLITGGLGGIGLAVAEMLARSGQVRLALLGRTPLPLVSEWDGYLAQHDRTDEVWRRIAAVRHLESLGAEVMACCADVADPAAVRAALAQVRARLGTIRGVVHAAGVAGGGLIQARSAEAAAAVLAPKVRGTVVLHDLVREDDPDFFVMCSSLSGITGDLGQVDYCAANAFLDAFAQACAAKGRPGVVAIDWDRWSEVGMAVAWAQREGWGPASPADPARPVHPLLGRRVHEVPDRVVFEATLRVSEHWPLDEHRISGVAVLPATALLELAHAAVLAVADGETLEIRQAYFLSPLAIDDDDKVRLRTVVEGGAGARQVTIASTVAGAAAPAEGDEPRWREHARATVAPLREGAERRRSIDEIAARCAEVVLDEDSPDGSGGSDGLDSPLAVGPRWQGVLRSVVRGEREVLASLELPEAFAADLDQYGLHPALLDVATGAAIGEFGLFQPFAYRGVSVHAPLPQTVHSHIRWDADPGRDTRQFRVTVMDENGTVLVDIDEFTLRRAEHAANRRVELAAPGILRSLALRPARRRMPEAGEVEIKVHAAALNFRDVLLAINPAETEGPALPLGLECAGEIVALGPGVTNFALGDPVIAVADGCFADYVTAPAAQVVPRPRHLEFAAAAGIPIAFTTAHHALHGLARLRAGERVLIHAAAGGVGLAAVALARRAGAEIFASAGTPEKRAFLASLGVEHVFDSRTLVFADELMDRTAGVGVDVVLNSLAGDFLIRSLETLAPFGRFLEIGKRDIRENHRLPLHPFRKGLSFFAVDVGPRLPGFPGLLREVVGLFAQRTLEPSPCQVFPAKQVAEAFEYMAAARHIGKVVVAMRETTPANPAEPTAGLSIMDNGVDGLRGLSTAAGLACLRRILDGSAPQVVVSTRPLDGRSHLPAARVASESVIAGSGTRRPRPELATGYVAPGSADEQRIASLWEEVLGIDRIGVADNFFDLGGTSLQILQIVALAMQNGVELTPEMHFRYPTIAELAAAPGALERESAADDA